MVKELKTLSSDAPISQALEIFKEPKSEGKTIFGIMVTNGQGSIVGMISI